jgi:hypothetical protein
MKLIFLVLSLFFAGVTSAYADLRICVQNFATRNMDLCARGGSPRHKYIKREDLSNEKLCVSTYADDQCKFNKAEFAHAITLDGKIVCVLNFNQPSVTGNYCASQPEFYAYALDPWL